MPWQARCAICVLEADHCDSCGCVPSCLFLLFCPCVVWLQRPAVLPVCAGHGKLQTVLTNKFRVGGLDVTRFLRFPFVIAVAPTLQKRAPAAAAAGSAMKRTVEEAVVQEGSSKKKARACASPLKDLALRVKVLQGLVNDIGQRLLEPKEIDPGAIDSTLPVLPQAFDGCAPPQAGSVAPVVRGPGHICGPKATATTRCAPRWSARPFATRHLRSRGTASGIES
jgi:hypothetical protein